MFTLCKKFYQNFEELFCAFSVAIMVGCLIAQVLIRMISGSSLAWTEELSRYSFLWTVYIAAAMSAKRNAHVRITAQFLPFSLGWRLAFRLFSDLLWVAFTLYIAQQSWLVIVDGLEFPEVSPTLHIIKSYVEMIIPAGFILMAFRIVEDYVTRLCKGTLLDLVREVGV